MGYNCNCGLISCPQCFSKALGVAQTTTNTTNVLGVPGPSIFEYEKQMGYIDPDMTYEEWRNQPVGSTNNVIELGDNA